MQMSFIVRITLFIAEIENTSHFIILNMITKIIVD